MEEYLDNEEQTVDEFEADLEKRVRDAVAAQFVLDQVAKKEEIAVNEGELQEHLMQRAQQSGQNPQEFVQHMIEHNHIPEMVAEVVRGKALALIVEYANVTDASGNHVELKLLHARRHDRRAGRRGRRRGGCRRCRRRDVAEENDGGEGGGLSPAPSRRPRAGRRGRPSRRVRRTSLTYFRVCRGHSSGDSTSAARRCRATHAPACSVPPLSQPRWPTSSWSAPCVTCTVR